MPVILATQEAEQEACGSKPALAYRLWDPISKNPYKKLVEQLKVKALSSNPVSPKKKGKGWGFVLFLIIATIDLWCPQVSGSKDSTNAQDA
jgi:hypothetical protein